MENEQAVIEETNTGSETPVEESNAQDLDSFLSEYETPEPPKKEEKEVQDDPDRERILAAVSRMEQQQTRDDIDASVKVVKSFAGNEDLNDDDVEAHLWMLAGKDQRFAEAFSSRDSNPAQWRKLLKAVGDKFANRKTDVKATNDWRQLESAVHSASKSTPEPEVNMDKKMSEMSDAEFFEYRRQLLGR